MKQEIIDSIKEEYEDIAKMIETNFSEAKDENITVARYKKLKKLEECYWLESSLVGRGSDDFAMYEALRAKFKASEVKETNNILMYISEMEYNTYLRLFREEMEGKDPNTSYVLYMDIEDETKYFVKSSDKEEFEKTHQVIVPYKNPDVSSGWNFERNYYGLQFIRSDFIKKAMYSNQEEATKQLIKKYPLTDKRTGRY